MGDVVRAYTDGLWAGEYFDGNDRYDMILQVGGWNSPEQLAAMPLATPQAGIQTIGELAEITRGVGPAQLQRVDGRRTITLFVVPLFTNPAFTKMFFASLWLSFLSTP